MLIVLGWIILILTLLGLIAGVVDEDYVTAFWAAVLSVYLGFTLDLQHRLRRAKKAAEFKEAVQAAVQSVDKRKQ